MLAGRWLIRALGNVTALAQLDLDVLISTNGVFMEILYRVSLILAAIFMSTVPALTQTQQPIQSEQEPNPIIYGLVVDTSKSMGLHFKEVIEAAKTVVNNNRPGDEVFVVRFIDSGHIETLQDFTSDKTAVLDALGKLFTELGQSAVVDAVYVSAQRLAQHKPSGNLRRPAMILITDGDDRASYYKQEQLYALLRGNRVQVFVIGLVNELNDRKPLLRKSSREKAIRFLQRLAQETGGRAFFLESPAELPGIADAIVSELRSQ